MSNAKKPKYALVLWNENDQYTIIHTTLIENVECLFNPTIVDLLPFPGRGEAPPEGWPKYPGCVLRLGDKKKVLEDQAEEIIQNFKVQQDKSRKIKSISKSKTIAAKRNAETIDNDLDEAEDIVKSRQTKRTKKGLDLESPLNVEDNGNDQHAELQKLLEENRNLKLENVELKRTIELRNLEQNCENSSQNFHITLQNGLTELPKIIQAAITNTLSTPEFCADLAKNIATQIKLPSTTQEAEFDTSIVNNPKFQAAEEAILEDCEKDQLDIACRSGDYKKVVRNLMDIMFPKETLLKSTLTGAKNSEVLDKKKVHIIEDYITNKYKNVATSQVRMQIGYKIRDVVKAEEKKKKIKFR